jgi:hypothetical protein
MRKILAIISALVVGGVIIPLLANLLPLAVDAIIGAVTGTGFSVRQGQHTYVEN